MPLLQSPTPIKKADYVVMESTYGNRLHLTNTGEEKARLFLDTVIKTLRRGGNVIIPSFAVGRTQEVLYDLDSIKDKTVAQEIKDEYKELMNATVYIDSPLATSATDIFKSNMELFDENAQKRILNGDNPIDFEGLIFTKTPEESKALNDLKEPHIIISASRNV